MLRYRGRDQVIREDPAQHTEVVSNIEARRVCVLMKVFRINHPFFAKLAKLGKASACRAKAT